MSSCSACASSFGRKDIERVGAAAWSTGGVEAERAARQVRMQLVVEIADCKPPGLRFCTLRCICCMSRVPHALPPEVYLTLEGLPLRCRPTGTPRGTPSDAALPPLLSRGQLGRQ